MCSTPFLPSHSDLLLTPPTSLLSFLQPLTSAPIQSNPVKPPPNTATTPGAPTSALDGPPQAPNPPVDTPPVPPPPPQLPLSVGPPNTGPNTFGNPAAGECDLRWEKHSSPASPPLACLPPPFQNKIRL